MSSIETDRAPVPVSGNFTKGHKVYPRYVNLALFFCAAATATCSVVLGAPAAIAFAAGGATMGLLFPAFFGVMRVKESCVSNKQGLWTHFSYGGMTAAAGLGLGALFYPGYQYQNEGNALKEKFGEVVRQCPSPINKEYTIATENGSTAKIVITSDGEAAMQNMAVRIKDYWSSETLKRKIKFGNDGRAILANRHH